VSDGDAVDRYWQSQVDRHGPNELPGSAGTDWEAELNPPAQEYAPVQQEPVFDETAFELDPDDFGAPDQEGWDEPGELDPYEAARGFVRDLVHEELDPGGPGPAYEAEYRQRQAEQTLADTVQAGDDDAAAWQQMREMISSAPELRGMGEQVLRENPQFGVDAVHRLYAITEEAGAALVRDGHSGADIAPVLEAHMGSFMREAIRGVQEQNGLAQIRREGAAHFRGGS
jgi:hypothetical protein